MGPLDPTLVIGGCGGLGFHVVAQLLHSGEAVDVTVLDIDTERNRVEGAHYVKGSVSSYQDVVAVLADVKPRTIFHVASPHLMHQSATPKLFEDVNVSGTRNLLDCIYKEGGVKILVYTSSTGIIHNGYTDIINANEEVPIFLDHPEFYAREQIPITWQTMTY
jgi:sterol-4alpha-carboxylate 3-dehydrogenase (decarboxylating)